MLSALLRCVPTPRIGFTLRDGGLLFFAGLYEEWRPQAVQSESTLTILTCDPNAVTRPIHTRMPVILADTKAQEDLINPAAGAAGIEPGQQPQERRPRLLIPTGLGETQRKDHHGRESRCNEERLFSTTRMATSSRFTVTVCPTRSRSSPTLTREWKSSIWRRTRPTSEKPSGS